MGTLTQTSLYHLLRWLLLPVIRWRIRIEVIGREHLPQNGPGILVCNHRSDTDPALLSITIPRPIAWVVADYMQHLPLTHWLIQHTGMVLMNVDGQVSPSSMKQAYGILKTGRLLGIFPEGEAYIFANDFSAPLAPLQPGFAVIAHRMQAPIIPAIICPVIETLEPLKIPQPLQAPIAQRYSLEELKHIVRYRAVKVVIGAPITSNGLHHDTKQAAIAHLCEQTRAAMINLQAQHG